MRSHCALSKRNGTIAIGRLERFLGDWEAAQAEYGASRARFVNRQKGCDRWRRTGRADGRRGSDQSRSPVVIFEALHTMGGVLSYGIPEFRLPKPIVEREVNYLRRLGVEMHTDFVVGKTRSLDSILEEYDAVFVATGAGLPWFMEMPGNNLNGVYSANEYLTRINLMKGSSFPRTPTPSSSTQRWPFWAAEMLRWTVPGRLCALARRQPLSIAARVRSCLPVWKRVENAEEEGVEFRYLTLPVRTIGDDNFHVTAIGMPADGTGRTRCLRPAQPGGSPRIGIHSAL